jgi:hypothetical protein
MARRKRKQHRDLQAPIIKFSAVFAAVTRWTGALLAGEGFAIPEDWLIWWLPASALLSAFMAVVEGWAFAYIFQAWWIMRNRERQQGAGSMSRVLLILTVLAAVTFVLVLTPYIAAQAQGSSMYQVTANPGRTEPILNSRLLLFAWSACVAASTISIVASVGIAQGARAEEVVEVKRVPVEMIQDCELCGQHPADMWEHWNRHRREIVEAGNLPNAMRVLTEKYGKVNGEILAEWQREL